MLLKIRSPNGSCPDPRSRWMHYIEFLSARQTDAGSIHSKTDRSTRHRRNQDRGIEWDAKPLSAPLPTRDLRFQLARSNRPLVGFSHVGFLDSTQFGEELLPIAFGCMHSLGFLIQATLAFDLGILKSTHPSPDLTGNAFASGFEM